MLRRLLLLGSIFTAASGCITVGMTDQGTVALRHLLNNPPGYGQLQRRGLERQAVFLSYRPSTRVRWWNLPDGRRVDLSGDCRRFTMHGFESPWSCRTDAHGLFLQCRSEELSSFELGRVVTGCGGELEPECKAGTVANADSEIFEFDAGYNLRRAVWTWEGRVVQETDASRSNRTYGTFALFQDTDALTPRQREDLMASALAFHIWQEISIGDPDDISPCPVRND